MKLLYGTDKEVKFFDVSGSSSERPCKISSYNGICTIDKYKRDLYYICDDNKGYMFDFDCSLIREDKLYDIWFSEICFTTDLNLYGHNRKSVYINTHKHGKWIPYYYKTHIRGCKGPIVSLKSSITTRNLFIQRQQPNDLCQILLLDVFRRYATVVDVDENFSDFVVDYTDSSKLYTFNHKQLMRFDILRNVTDMEFECPESQHIFTVASSPVNKQRVLVGGSGGHLSLIDTDVGRPVMNFSTHYNKDVTAISLGLGFSVAVGFSNGRVKLFDMRIPDKSYSTLKLSDDEPVRNLMLDTKAKEDHIGFDLGDNRFDDSYGENLYSLCNSLTVSDTSNSSIDQPEVCDKSLENNSNEKVNVQLKARKSSRLSFQPSQDDIKEETSLQMKKQSESPVQTEKKNDDSNSEFYMGFETFQDDISKQILKDDTNKENDTIPLTENKHDLENPSSDTFKERETQICLEQFKNEFLQRIRRQNQELLEEEERKIRDHREHVGKCVLKYKIELESNLKSTIKDLLEESENQITERVVSMIRSSQQQ